MEDYYCHKCSVELGHLNSGSVDHINFTGSSYQLGKYLKHTLPPTQSGLISVFDDPEYSAYSSYTINTLASGSTQFDQHHRKNVIWYASESVGITYQDGVPHCPADTIKVVLSHDDNKIHTFPVNSGDLITKTCKRCGTNVLTGSTGQ